MKAPIIFYGIFSGFIAYAIMYILNYWMLKYQIPQFMMGFISCLFFQYGIGKRVRKIQHELKKEQQNTNSNNS